MQHFKIPLSVRDKKRHIYSAIVDTDYRVATVDSIIFVLHDVISCHCQIAFFINTVWKSDFAVLSIDPAY